MYIGKTYVYIYIYAFVLLTLALWMTLMDCLHLGWTLESASFFLDVVRHPAPNSTFFRPNAPAWAASKTVEIGWVHEENRHIAGGSGFCSSTCSLNNLRIIFYTTPMNPAVIEIKQGTIENWEWGKYAWELGRKQNNNLDKMESSWSVNEVIERLVQRVDVAWDMMGTLLRCGRIQIYNKHD